MRSLLVFVLAITVFGSCQSKPEEGIPVVNLSALAAIPLDKPIDTLAKGVSFIDVQLPKGARIEELSKNDLALVKAAAYRFFGKVKLVGNQYVTELKDGKEIHVADNIVSSYLKAIQDTNTFVDSLKSKGEEIRLPEITNEYRNTLLK